MPIDAPDVVHLRGGGVSLAVETRGPHLPRVLHWGADLGPLTPAELAALLATADTATTVASRPSWSARTSGRRGHTPRTA